MNMFYAVSTNYIQERRLKIINSLTYFLSIIFHKRRKVFLFLLIRSIRYAWLVCITFVRSKVCRERYDNTYLKSITVSAKRYMFALPSHPGLNCIFVNISNGLKYFNWIDLLLRMFCCGYSFLWTFKLIDISKN